MRSTGEALGRQRTECRFPRVWRAERGRRADGAVGPVERDGHAGRRRSGRRPGGPSSDGGSAVTVYRVDYRKAVGTDTFGNNTFRSDVVFKVTSSGLDSTTSSGCTP